MATLAGTPEIALLAEAKAYLRIETDAEDALLAGLLRSAQAMVEAWVGQLLVRRLLVEEGVIREGGMRLACGPVEQILSVAWSGDGAPFAELPAGQWSLRLIDGARGRIDLGPSRDGRLRVSYRAGLAEGWNDVPEPLRLAVVRTAAHGFTHRDSAEDAGVPPVVRQMLAAWRRLRLV